MIAGRNVTLSSIASETRHRGSRLVKWIFTIKTCGEMVITRPCKVKALTIYPNPVREKIYGNWSEL